MFFEEDFPFAKNRLKEYPWDDYQYSTPETMKRKKWHLLLILAVGALTLFNVLPTVIYYLKPLDRPIDSAGALGIAREMTHRMESVNEDTTGFLSGLARANDVKPVDMVSLKGGGLKIKFETGEAAWKYAGALFRASGNMPFAPGRFQVGGVEKEGDCFVVQIKCLIRSHIDPERVQNHFGFAAATGENGRWTPAMRQLIYDRTAHVIQHLSSSSEVSFLLQVASQNDEVQPMCLDLARRITGFAKTYGMTSAVAKRYYSSFSNGMGGGSSSLLKIAFEKQKRSIEGRIARLEKKQPEGYKTRTAQLKSKKADLTEALAVVERQKTAFDRARSPLSKSEIIRVLGEKENAAIHRFDLGARDPFIAAVSVDEKSSVMEFILHADVVGKVHPSEVINHLAMVAKESGEALSVDNGHFIAPLHELKGAGSFLTLDLREMMKEQCAAFAQEIRARFDAKDEALQASEVLTYDAFMKRQDKNFKGFVICAPALHDGELPIGLSRSSIYVMVRGLEEAMKKPSEKLKADMSALRQILYTGANGYDYPSAYIPLPDLFHGDYFFEVKEPFDGWLKGTREKWRVLGSKRVAVLELSTEKQRIDEINRIETDEQNDLLRWRDDYRTAQVDIDPLAKAAFAPPSKSPLWNNFKLSFKKYFRGDPRRVLKWGLDLSGGKTVHIQLLDKSGQIVTEPADLAQATSELYTRANRLGISEVAVRSEGNYIVMDFPGSQNLSARELVSGSSMIFHIVNESFSPASPRFGTSANQFLAQVWNEAQMRGDTSSENIERISTELLERAHAQSGSPAHALWNGGLRLAPLGYYPEATFENTLSKVVKIRGDERGEWMGQSHPLMFVFANFALEGSSLADVHAGYDPEKGNYLSFKVLSERSIHGRDEIHPQNLLGRWTTEFAKTGITKSSLGEMTSGRGWRMAVVLNDEVISAPALEAAINDGGMITGSFTPREVSRLESDLKAGSLSFTPKILSESNISPELGLSERTRGVFAMVLSLFAVMVIMLAVYRFGGFVASLCVIFNLLIMWAIFQSLGAVLSLATIAGMVLTIGMAVDANVLVFERIREEYAKSHNLKHALNAGYRRAFSAIFDSNLTTVAAAFILLNFDSGPIKGFALTIVVGIASSMFTALFVSRYFFSGWVENPRNKELSMRPLFARVNWNFFKGSRIYACVIALVVALGAFTAASQGRELLGMDFTGGYAVSLDLVPGAQIKERTQKALLTGGLSSSDFRLRTLEASHKLKLMLAPNFESRLPSLKSPTEKVAWIFQQLEKEGIAIEKTSALKAEQSWVEMSSELSDAMTSQALMGLGLALIAILLYISWRFEAMGAFAAVVCLMHDVVITLCMVSVLRYLGLDLQIDLHTIAALMTIVGYSLNDTIIVFDRVREQRELKITGGLRDQLNRALGATLSRTVMTSVTTLVVLLFLMSSGGGVIFGFACVMTTGVIFGTLSSLLLAGPLWAWLADRKEKLKTEKASTQSMRK